MPPSDTPSPRMLFLIGRGRSGTTLLKSMLDAHPDLCVAPEALFVMNLYPHYRKGEWDQRRVAAFAQDLWLEHKLATWNLDRDGLKEELLATGNPGFAALCARVYACYAARQGKRAPAWLGDKNPHYALFVSELMDAFPDAKFVHIVRDYRDNILSYQHMRFDLGGAAALAYRWRDYNERVLSAAARHPERFFRLRYEDLVCRPESELKGLCEFLEVPFAEAMLTFYERHQEEARDWHKNLAKPPDPAMLDRWKERMPGRDVARAERICGALGERLGYARSLPPRTAPVGMPGAAWGWAVTRLERLLFHMPIRIRSRVIETYRRLTGSVRW